VTGDESEAAREDLWLTYQNYDPAVKQAVRRLGALPGNNVEEFRTLLLASRERSRAKEFEADVVRRLQGEAFVDDDVLQQTLIVLHAENPQLAEAFKTFVAVNGRPDDIDLTVARLRSGTDDPVMPERMPRKPRERPVMAHMPEVPPDSVPPAPEEPAHKPSLPVEDPRPALVVSRVVTAKAPAPQPANDLAHDIPRDRKEAPRASWPKYAAALAVILLAGAGALYVLMPKSADKPASFEATSVPLRQAAVEDKQPAPANEPSLAAASQQPAPAQAAPAQSAPAQPDMETHNEVRIPAPPPPEPLAPEAAAVPASPNGPVPGTRYRVVRGDMLSAIALEAYGDASMFRLIQRANPGLRNADHIYSDQVIVLPPEP
jgi:nucleoid-associated protein YgaU